VVTVAWKSVHLQSISRGGGQASGQLGSVGAGLKPAPTGGLEII